jgi:hypothetical protein
MGSAQKNVTERRTRGNAAAFELFGNAAEQARRPVSSFLRRRHEAVLCRIPKATEENGLNGN